MELRRIPRVNLIYPDFKRFTDQCNRRHVEVSNEIVTKLTDEVSMTDTRMNEVMNSGTKADSLVTKEQIQSAIENQR